MSVFSNMKEVRIKVHGEEYKNYNGMVISPSGLRNFYNNPIIWYRNVVLKEKTFTGNKETIFGSLVHLYAELFYSNQLNKDGSMPESYRNALLRHENSELISDIDFDHLKLVCSYLNEEYLSIYPTPVEVEGYVEYDYDDSIKIAGSFDALEMNRDGTYTVIDFKTARASSTDFSKYILQLSVYASLLELTKGITVSHLRVVEIVKTKTPKIQVLTTAPDIELANESISLAIKSIKLSQSNPEMISLLFKDNIFSYDTENKSGKEDIEISTSKGIQMSKLKQDIFG